MSETYDILKALDNSFHYQVNCELTPEQCKWLLDVYEKYNSLQSYVFKLDKIEFDLKQRIAELEEQQRWKPLSELPEENMEMLVKTDRNYIMIIDTNEIDEFNENEKENFGYGAIKYFMELPEVIS